jgi:hypothetical protein
MPNAMRDKASTMARGDAVSDNSGPGSVAHLARGVEKSSDRRRCAR